MALAGEYFSAWLLLLSVAVGLHASCYTMQVGRLLCDLPFTARCAAAPVSLAVRICPSISRAWARCTLNLTCVDAGPILTWYAVIRLQQIYAYSPTTPCNPNHNFLAPFELSWKLAHRLLLLWRTFTTIVIFVYVCFRVSVVHSCMSSALGEQNFTTMLF